jgi:hypothetical protein
MFNVPQMFNIIGVETSAGRTLISNTQSVAHNSGGFVNSWNNIAELSDDLNSVSSRDLSFDFNKSKYSIQLVPPSHENGDSEQFWLTYKTIWSKSTPQLRTGPSIRWHASSHQYCGLEGFSVELASPRKGVAMKGNHEIVESKCETRLRRNIFVRRSGGKSYI